MTDMNVEESLTRIVQAIKLVNTIMRERNSDLSVLSTLGEIPPSALVARTKAFNVTSGLFAEVGVLFGRMSKGDVDCEGAWGELCKRCEVTLNDLSEQRRERLHEEIHQQLAQVSAVQGKQLSPTAQKFAKRHWSRIANSEPDTWLKASDEALRFFLVLFLIDGLTFESPFTSLPPQTQTEVIALGATLRGDDRWLFERHMESAS
jgi:hypothetical protein